MSSRGGRAREVARYAKLSSRRHLQVSHVGGMPRWSREIAHLSPPTNRSVPTSFPCHDAPHGTGARL